MSSLHLIPKKRLHITDLSAKVTTQISQAFLFGWLGSLLWLIAVVGSVLLELCFGSVLSATAVNGWDTWLLTCF